MTSSDHNTIVITGASSGIGRELAIQLAAPGRSLWLVARNEERLAEVGEIVQTKGAEARIIALDISDVDAGERFLKAEVRSGRRIDQLYFAAAVSLFGEVKDVLEEDWDRLYRTDLLSCVQWVHAVYSGMVARRSGAIVIVSSLAGYIGYPTSVPYAAMKAGLVGLFRSLRYEAEQYGVRLHLVAPGYVDTGIYRAAAYRGTSYEDTMKVIAAMGFKMISAERAAAATIKGVTSGKREIVFPGYARVMAALGLRIPWGVSVTHDLMLKRFRSIS